MIGLNSKLVGTRMKQKRIEKGLTQADVATKSGISSRYYGSIENGKNSPSIETLNSISIVIGCSLHFLLNDRMDD
ncbi:TPA: helix-turn-helix transcriptional regulator, partial [Enterococcus faecium]|nr:helix-turn-helix transcriptional regulator [Enterococcus faecium]